MKIYGGRRQMRNDRDCAAIKASCVTITESARQDYLVRISRGLMYIHHQKSASFARRAEICLLLSPFNCPFIEKLFSKVVDITTGPTHGNCCDFRD